MPMLVPCASRGCPEWRVLNESEPCLEPLPTSAFVPKDGIEMPCLTMNHGSGSSTGVTEMLLNFSKTLPRAPTGVIVIEAHGFGVAGLGIAVHGDGNLSKAIMELLPDARSGYVSGHGVRDCVPAFCDVPVVAVSLRGTEDPSEHLAMGAALAPLRKQGVVIVGSGVPSIHNFEVLFRNPTNANIQKSFLFDAWLTSAVSISAQKERFDMLKTWDCAPGARVCHSEGAAEHFFPTLVVAGAAGDHSGAPCFPESHPSIIGLKKNAELKFPARHYVFGG